MPNNTIQKIDEALATLATEKSIEAGLSLASYLLQHMSTAGIKSTDPNSADFILLTALKLPNAERYDHWFQAHPKFKSDRACFALNDIKQGPLEAKLYALKTKKKLYISGAAHFTPNFEDALFTRQDPNAKVGIDFFLPPANDSLLVVVSNNKSLRVVELKDRLTNTQKDIFAKWSNVASLEREQLHLTIWDSFKLKSINEAFYKGIANSFKDLVSHLEVNGKSSNEARYFANRLHGRLLFCWFLDKKGFINREVNYFDTTHTNVTQYYKDKLELLFFDTLNTPQNERERSHPDQKTPYLNGGLFEAQPDDWRGSNVPFPQGFFVRLYEHFGEFNFTTDESTPDYEQIAIDPEMLGKIFENLLAEINEDTGEQARKAKGAFYTPRDIVAYMCRESVREYLYTATKAGEKAKVAIDKLLDTSDSDWAKSGTNSRRDTGEVALRENIITALNMMKVLDPACGSGAFPIGMLHLLVQLYERLDSRFDPYRTKLGIMQQNIYGVDIEPLAIDIARLRSFLALVVDQEYVEKKPNGGIDTLPNLEFKFVCANTLIPLTRQSSLGDSGKYESLLEIKQDYFRANPKQREKLETKYSTLRRQGTMFDSTLNEQLQTYDPFNNERPASFYDQNLMHDITDAFDVVIGNPPYVRQEKIKYKDLLSDHYEVFNRVADLYTYFYERGLKLIKDEAVLSYITSNKFFRARYGVSLRTYLKLHTSIKSIVNFGDKHVFDAITNTVVFTATKSSINDVVFKYSDSITQTIGEFEQSKLNNTEWTVGSSSVMDLKAKIESKGLPLKDWEIKMNYGIKTGLNNAFMIDEETRAKIVSTDRSSDQLLKPIIRGRDISRYAYTPSNLYLISTFPALNIDINKFKGIKKHLEEFGKDKLVQEGIEYKDGSKSRKKTGNEWFETQDQIGYYKEFKEEKIIWIELTDKNKFAYSNKEDYILAGAFMMTGKNLKYLLSFLNSKLCLFYFNLIANSSGMDTTQWKKFALEKIPVPKLSIEKQTPFIELVDKIIATKTNDPKRDTLSLEAEIDQLFYTLYELTADEVALIEHG